MIKWEHSIFALPFALTGAMLAAAGWPAWRKVFWIVVCMVTARSAAMAFNRWADARLDAANPRTAGARDSRWLAEPPLCRRLYRGDVAGFYSGRGAAEPGDPIALSCGPRGAPAVLLHQAVHPLVSPGARPGARDCPRRSLDRHPRNAGSAHRSAHRGGSFLGGRIRCALRLPGHGARPGEPA